MLQQHNLHLYGLPQEELQHAVHSMEQVTFAAGEPILKEGAIGNDAFIILQGTVQVYTRNLIGRLVLLAELEAGTIIGEIALLHTERRTASVRALTDVSALRIERSVFNALAQASPLFYESIRMSAEIRYVHAQLRKASIWSAIPDSELRGLAEITVRRPVQRGDVIIYEGERTELLYLITAGRFEVRTARKRRAVLGEGDFFGEIALLADVPHTGTLVALEDGELLLMGSQEFAYVLQQYPPVLLQFIEVFRIRRSDLTLSEPFASMYESNEESTRIVAAPSTKKESSKNDFMKLPVRKRMIEGKWLEVLLALGALFLVFTIVASVSNTAIWGYAALGTGALVGPITFVTYVRHTQLLGYRTRRLMVVFIASALVATPLAWVLEKALLFSSSNRVDMTTFRDPLLVATIEEIAKLVVCGWLLWYRRYRFLMDAIVFGAAAGMGFAALETIVYGIGQVTDHSAGSMLVVTWVRALLSPFGHGTWTAIAAAGVWLGLQRWQKSGMYAVILLLIPVVLHTLWNYDTTDGLANVGVMAMTGVVGLYVLYVLIRNGQRAEHRALVRTNPLLEEHLLEWELGNDPHFVGQAEQAPTILYCEGCSTQSPSHARYCARCGQSLRLKRT